MATATFRLTGTTPLLTHNPAGMIRRDVSSGMKRKAIPTAEDEAAGGVYYLPDKRIAFPAQGCRNSLVDGGQGMKIGRSGANKVLDVSVFVTTELVPILDPDTLQPISGYEIDVRRVVVVGGGIMRARPKFPRWCIDVELEYDESVNKAIIVEAFEQAGRKVGLGEHRPKAPKGKGGPFGRYTVKLVG